MGTEAVKESNERTSKRTSVWIRESLSAPSRKYIYNKDVYGTYMKEYKFLQADTKLLNFAMDEAGHISDCYILYAVAMMGVADLEAIRLFLSALSKNNKELNIPDTGNPSTIRLRLARLKNDGLLFKHMYKVDYINEEGNTIVNDVSLYTLPRNAQTFMNNKLLKHTTVNEWIQAKPLFELIGWCSCGYAAGRISQNNFFISQKQGVFKTNMIGTAILPDVLKMKTNSSDDAFIGFVPAYLHKESSFQTDKDFEEACEYMVKLISQFFYFHDTRKHYVRVVVVVQDNPDLVLAGQWISRFESLEDDYDRIFFTGEGILKKTTDAALNNCFLRMKKSSTKAGYSFVPAKPDFIGDS